ncbi:aldolase [Burkholderia cepacia]|uniref:aldolase n=1 Tax=Burkholderia cepacia TaxID=292 RepID=UPI00249EFF1F|nr:aldolase [Burkholderia cepacia]WGY71345.1 aldolase [Burkholderia cepacia]
MDTSKSQNRKFNSKDSILERVNKEFDKEIRRNSEWTIREKFSAAAHILAAEGHSPGLAGQITARIDNQQFLTLPVSLGFDEAATSNLIVIDDDLHVIEGNGMANEAVRFHLWIYDARPDVCAIVHTHAPATSALAMIGQPLTIAHMDMTMFQDQCAYLSDWPGLPISDDEGVIISQALGDKKSILLANHGLLTVGASIEEATYLAFFFERAAAMQLSALASGAICAVDPDKAREAGAFLMKRVIVEQTFDYWARKYSSISVDK